MPRLPERLTPVDFLKFNQMITRIRTLEHVATEHFFRGNSDYRQTIAEVIKLITTDGQKGLPNPDHHFFTSPDPDKRAARLAAAEDPTLIPADALDNGRVGHGCSLPYCPSGGICELCDYEETQELLLKAVKKHL